MVDKMTAKSSQQSKVFTYMLATLSFLPHHSSLKKEHMRKMSRILIYKTSQNIKTEKYLQGLEGKCVRRKVRKQQHPHKQAQDCMSRLLGEDEEETRRTRKSNVKKAMDSLVYTPDFFAKKLLIIHQK